MCRTAFFAVTALLSFRAGLNATVVTFDTDPFAGSTALTTPGRQIVGGEPSITFSIAPDLFAFAPGVFGVSQILFANDLAANLPTSGVNTIVLRSFDNDGNSGTPFGAGNAADLIAAQLTAPGAGFFIYFNSGLDLARLVYSTNLNESTSDLKILARMTNLSGQAGRDAFPTFTQANFTITPEPSTFVLMTAAGALWAGTLRRRRSRKA